MLAQTMFDIGFDRAVDHVQSYFRRTTSGGPWFTGSHFESFAGGGDRYEPNRITAEDLVAVSFLAVDISGDAALALIETRKDEVAVLLRALPVDLQFERLTKGKFKSLMCAQGNPAQALWDLLRSGGDSWGIGPTRASKIMARKRPHLIPIFDSVMEEAAGLKGDRHQWTTWWNEFHGPDGNRLVDHLTKIRLACGKNDLSLLRVLDIAIWMDRHGAAKMHG
ncbi:DUF6308 family protein [Tersicoccus sp. MR15.9]|uniref:DUF6308 family protein n=1 Tax=Tersicoccus mangrovi TaxID=3121635 RepID=UPI002FE62B72